MSIVIIREIRVSFRIKDSTVNSRKPFLLLSKCAETQMRPECLTFLLFWMLRWIADHANHPIGYPFACHRCLPLSYFVKSFHADIISIDSAFSIFGHRGVPVGGPWVFSTLECGEGSGRKDPTLWSWCRTPASRPSSFHQCGRTQHSFGSLGGPGLRRP